MDNFGQALIAPLFLTAELFFMAGRMHELKLQIYGKQSEPEIIKADDTPGEQDK